MLKFKISKLRYLLIRLELLVGGYSNIYTEDVETGLLVSKLPKLICGFSHKESPKMCLLSESVVFTVLWCIAQQRRHGNTECLLPGWSETSILTQKLFKKVQNVTMTTIKN